MAVLRAKPLSRLLVPFGQAKELARRQNSPVGDNLKEKLTIQIKHKRNETNHG